ncbi:MAG: carboxylesterase family protein [Cyclobacteriaceae bacterium]|jgi:para-nitrobenzyl esterase|nr:carboxylesterase family protein [Cyclobacteriaceae bacterium]
MFRLVVIVLLVVGYAQAQNDSGIKDKTPIVNTTSGNLSGLKSDDGKVTIFKGVPYAKPPVGELRWKAPQPVKPSANVRECKDFSPSAMQNTPQPFMMWTEEFIAPPESLSEDCLYLNIWTPSTSNKAKLPVLVWIHGGAFVSGSASCAVYDGEALAREGIVYVSINYRLGIFGFLAHPELSIETPHHASGNYGIMDQIEALRWIKENITSFGGDPEKVTIAGQSAGSMSVQSLVASPLTKGLFRGAIAQSGATLNRPTKSLEEAEKEGQSLSQKTGTFTIEALRKLPADSLLKLGNTMPFGTFAPITDGYVIPEDMRTIFSNKKHNDVPLMAGWVMGDGALMRSTPQTVEQFKAMATSLYGDHAKEFLELFPAGTEEEIKTSQDKLGLMNFAAFPDYLWAISNRSNSFLYQFSYIPTDKPGFPNYGAFHTSEVPYALHTLNKWNRPWQNSDYLVEHTMSAYWINFVKTGNPNGKNVPEWNPFQKELQMIMEFGHTPVLRKGLYQAEFEFLESNKR